MKDSFDDKENSIGEDLILCPESNEIIKTNSGEFDKTLQLTELPEVKDEASDQIPVVEENCNNTGEQPFVSQQTEPVTGSRVEGGTPSASDSFTPGHLQAKETTFTGLKKPGN